MPLRNRVAVSWGEETYEIVITLDVIDQIESRIDVVGMMASGRIRLAATAKFVHAILCACDDKYLSYDPSEVYLDISNDDGLRKNSQDMIAAVTNEMFPTKKKEKKKPQKREQG